MHGIQTFYDSRIFCPVKDIQNFISPHRKLAAGLCEAPSCADFNTVGTLGRRSGVLDMFSMVAVNLSTEDVLCTLISCWTMC